MVFLKCLPRIKALLLIIILVQMTWGQQSASPAKTEPRLITRKSLKRLGNELAGCEENATTCNRTFGAGSIVNWLQYSSWRNPERSGLDALDFSDFAALHKKYGNALATLKSVNLEEYGTYPKWVWNVPLEEGDWGTVVVEQCLRTRLNVDKPGYLAVLRRRNRCLASLEISTDTYAAILARLMARNVKGPVAKDQLVALLAADGEERVKVDQFVDFMISKQ